MRTTLRQAIDTIGDGSLGAAVTVGLIIASVIAVLGPGARPPTVRMQDPGALIHGRITLSASAGEPASGVALVRIQRAPTGTDTWNDVCAVPISPYRCSLNTARLANGPYDFRAIAVDRAGYSATSTTVTYRVVANAPR